MHAALTTSAHLLLEQTASLALVKCMQFSLRNGLFACVHALYVTRLRLW